MQSSKINQCKQSQCATYFSCNQQLILRRGCVKNRSDVLYLCGFFCYLSVARLWESAREFTFQFLCVYMRVCVIAWPAVCMLTTLILCVEPLAWEPIYSASPRVSLPLSHSSSHYDSSKPYEQGEKVTFHPPELSLNS